MAFQSQIAKSKATSRRGMSSPIIVAQTFKPSTSSEELSFRLSSTLLADIGLKIGGRADVLYDSESDCWMVSASDDGFSISGKPDAPSGLIRYTLKPGHARLTKNRADLPVKRECDIDSLKIISSSVVFSLNKVVGEA